MSQGDFNDAVLNLLEALVEKEEPHGRYDEPKHGIVGDPLTNLLHIARMAKPEDNDRGHE